MDSAQLPPWWHTATGSGGRRQSQCGGSIGGLPVVRKHGMPDGFRRPGSYQDRNRLGASRHPHGYLDARVPGPGCNGYEATFALRQDRRTSGTIILAFTALNDDAEVRELLADHSFDGYCQKGQPPSKLVTLLMSFAQ